MINNITKSTEVFTFGKEELAPDTLPIRLKPPKFKFHEN